MSLSNDSTTMVMPVAPAYQGGGYGYGNGCGSMWGGDWASWIILFLIFGMFGWGGYGNFGGGFGGGNGLGSPSGQGWAPLPARAGPPAPTSTRALRSTAYKTASATLQPPSATASMAWITLCANWAIMCSRALTRFPANWQTVVVPHSARLMG